MSNADTNNREPYFAVVGEQAVAVLAAKAAVDWKAVELAGQVGIFALCCQKLETRRFSTNKVAAAHIHSRSPVIADFAKISSRKNGKNYSFRYLLVHNFDIEP